MKPQQRVVVEYERDRLAVGRVLLVVGDWAFVWLEKPVETTDLGVRRALWLPPQSLTLAE